MDADASRWSWDGVRSAFDGWMEWTQRRGGWGRLETKSPGWGSGGSLGGWMEGMIGLLSYPSRLGDYLASVV